MNDDNEHFLVFEASQSEELFAVWAQSSVEGHGDNHLVRARSNDAINWPEPDTLLEPTMVLVDFGKTSVSR